MFIDLARIRAIGGTGGKGCCSFRRESFVPRGGPNGGDGGNGGDIIIVATSRLTTLGDLRFHSTWRGRPGAHGRGSDQHGKNARETVVHVPLGTMVRHDETGEILADLTEEDMCFIAAHGGKGGKGNARFASANNRVPRFAEKGEPGEDRYLRLELKTIAEVGLVGLPNAGKSTLLSMVSAATPKIADYPFTTLAPNLGVVSLDNYRRLTMADIPGIIEGAAEGKGLGHAFLRHIERTRVLLFLLDTGDEDPLETKAVLEKELAQHSPLFAERPRFFALNKIDITENRARLDALCKHFDNVFPISAATHEGVAELLEALWTAVERVRREEAEAETFEPEKEYVYEAPFSIEEESKGFRVEGKRILRAVRMTDFDNEEAIYHLHDILSKMGLFKSLKRLGAQPGQSIFIGDVELEYHPD